MGPQQLYVNEKLAEERRKEVLREMELRRLLAHLPHHSNMGRHAIARFGAFLVALGMLLERVEPHEAKLSSAS